MEKEISLHDTVESLSKPPSNHQLVRERLRQTNIFHPSCLIDSCLRHRSYYDFPPQLCHNRHSHLIHQTVSQVSLSCLWRKGEREKTRPTNQQQQILPGCAIHLSQLDSVRCGSLCEWLEHTGLVGILVRFMPAYYPCDPLLTLSLTQQF